MSKILLYNIGGLCNRLRPLSSVFALANQMNRELEIFWPPDKACGAEFSDLFTNDFPIMSEIKDLDFSNETDCVIYTSPSRINRDYSVYKREGLIDLADRVNVINNEGLINLNIEENTIIIFLDNFIRNITNIDYVKVLKSLTPTKEIQTRIDEQKNLLGLNKTIIGVHARTTDFYVDHKPYSNRIRDVLDKNPNQKFFVTSEYRETEQAIKEEFGDCILLYDKKYYIVKEDDKNASWGDNILFTKESVIEAVVDLYLLSYTDLQIYNPISTFAEVSKLLGE